MAGAQTHLGTCELGGSTPTSPESPAIEGWTGSWVGDAGRQRGILGPYRGWEWMVTLSSSRRPSKMGKGYLTTQVWDTPGTTKQATAGPLIRGPKENVELERVISGQVGAEAQMQSRSPRRNAESGEGEQRLASWDTSTYWAGRRDEESQRGSQGKEQPASPEASRREAGEGCSEKDRAINRAKFHREGRRMRAKQDWAF